MAVEDTSPVALVEQALELARSRSLRRDRIDWDEISREFRGKAASCRSLEQAHAVIRELLWRLADGHSFLCTPMDITERRAPNHSGLRLHQEVPIVIDVFNGSPAEATGVRNGDRVARVGSERVTEENWRRLRGKALGADEHLMIERDNWHASGDPFTLDSANAFEVSLPKGYARPHATPAGHLTASGHAVLDLPGHDGDGDLGNSQKYDDAVASLLQELGGLGARGWIVDLRRCDGGNMWPLLAGLAPLLGVGRYGSFVDPIDDVWFDWGFDGETLRVVNRHDQEESYLMAEIPAWRPLTDADAPVAILTSGVTSSSAEAVLISFLGRPRTRTFGESTGGLTTSNNFHVLADGSWLLLAETLEADRDDRIYSDRIEPDEHVAVDWQKLGSPEDPVLRAAERWLDATGSGLDRKVK